MNLEFIPPRFNEDILLSIMKEHSDRIFSGDKHYELRKIIPKSVPRRVFVYEAEGSKCVVGHFVVEQIVSGPPALLWDRVGAAASTRSRFFRYFEGRSVGYAYEIGKAVRYCRPIPLSEIQALDQKINVPQSFQYLEFSSPARRALFRAAQNAALADDEQGIALRPITNDLERRFVQLVEQHISGSYEETGSAYARKLLEISATGDDPEGIITQSKSVLQVLFGGTLAGFVVLTEKAGGSLKTGPTVFLDEFQGKGIGVHLRHRLHSYALSLGYRKVYCTFPASKIELSKYLLRANYRLEAQLRKHYHADHDELVFGFNLSKYRFPAVSPQRSFTELLAIERLEAYDPELVQFLEEQFAYEVCPVPPGWAETQVRKAAACTKGRRGASNFKARWIFVARGMAIEAACLVMFKRGGSAKLIVLTSTANPIGLVKLIRTVEKSITRSKYTVRKLYTHVRVGDSTLFEVLFGVGYAPEGLLDRPYVDWHDTVVVGKLLEGQSS
jgi:predicted transcriptional regulator/GNAT superfamily N-acetyltransferase/HAMP domain-containing protein